MIKKTAISTESAPAAIGPYSQAIQSENFIFTSGQLGMDTAKNFPETAAEQAVQSLQNARAILASANCEMDKVVKTTIFLTDMADFPQVNEVYSKFFNEPYPARSTIQVAALPMGAKVEIEIIARL
jgi:2-iminobutanoate/2-iminopropanoate deaminase